MREVFQNGNILVTWTSKGQWNEDGLELMAGDSWLWAYENNTGATYLCLMGLELTILNSPI
jgi:hypothetical protein